MTAGSGDALSLASAMPYGGAPVGPDFAFQPSQRYPDPRIEVLDPSFARYRIYSSTVEQLGSGMRWAEGPVYFADGRFLLVSDIPNNRIMRYDETTGAWGVFRQPSNFANGMCRDRQGRLLTCEHLTRRVTRTEYDGRVTVLADSYRGKRLNSPNDIVCRSDGSVWFTDPVFGIGGHWEGDKATPELPQSVYRISPAGELSLVTDELAGPNGLAFSPDEATLYIAESRATPHRLIAAYDVAGDGQLSNRRVAVDAQRSTGLVQRDLGLSRCVPGKSRVTIGLNGAIELRDRNLDREATPLRRQVVDANAHGAKTRRRCMRSASEKSDQT